MKKINRDLFILFFALIIAIVGICANEMKNDYAELVLGESDDEKNSCSVF